jgi:hypothetical protein
MGNIRVGQKSPQTVNMGGFTIAPNDGATVEKKGGMTAEEKKVLVEKIMQMPKDQIVPELRKHGFSDIADITEAQMKQDAKEYEKKARAARLAEIQSMDEQEQLPLLLEEGFEEEAKALSDKLAKEAVDDKTATDAPDAPDVPETPDAPDAPDALDAADSAEKKEDNAKGKPGRKASAKKTK